eukprot:1143352-Pelagomonas_calceolata.AAC.3
MFNSSICLTTVVLSTAGCFSPLQYLSAGSYQISTRVAGVAFSLKYRFKKRALKSTKAASLLVREPSCNSRGLFMAQCFSQMPAKVSNEGGRRPSRSVQYGDKLDTTGTRRDYEVTSDARCISFAAKIRYPVMLASSKPPYSSSICLLEKKLRRQ